MGQVALKFLLAGQVWAGHVSFEYRKTETKPITYQLDYSANPIRSKTINQNQSTCNCLIIFNTQLKTALNRVGEFGFYTVCKYEVHV